MFKFLPVSEPTCTHIHFIHTHLSFLHHFFELFITFFQQSHSLQIHPNLTSCSITPTHKDKIHPRYTSRYTHLTDRHTYEIIKFGLLPISDRQTDRHTHINTLTSILRTSPSPTSASFSFGCFSEVSEATCKNTYNVHLDLDTPTLQTDIRTKLLNSAFFQYLTDIQTHIHTNPFFDFASSFSIFHACLSVLLACLELNCLDGFLLARLSLAGEVNSESLRLWTRIG